MAIKSKKVKISGRQRKKLRIRKRVEGTTARPRISVFKSSKYSYAQIISDQSGSTLISASSKEGEVLELAKSFEGEQKGPCSPKSISAARALGVTLAKRSLAQGLDKVVFDRNGYIYHGRVKAIAEGAREGGLKF